MYRSICLLGLAAIAACSDSSSPDSRYACIGDTLPTTAPNPIHVTGQTKYNALSPTALGGVQVIASTGTDTLAADTSDTPGFYDLTIPTGGTPVNGFLKLQKSGYLTSYAYPSRPLAANAINNVLMITSSEFTLLSGATGVTQNAGNGFIGMVVADCNGNPLSGATVSVSPAGSSAARYNAGSTPSSSATSTSGDGVAYVFNVTAGNATVQASAGGHTLHAHIVNARADVITLTEIQP